MEIQKIGQILPLPFNCRKVARVQLSFDLDTFFKKNTLEVEILREEKQDFEIFLVFLNIKTLSKLKKLNSKKSS